MKTTIPALQKGDLIYITSPAKSIDNQSIILAKDFFENGCNVNELYDALAKELLIEPLPSVEIDFSKQVDIKYKEK